MVNPPRRKGTMGETDFVRWMHEQGETQVDRHALHGGKDVGDINGVPGLVVSVKRPGKGQPIKLSGWLNDLSVMQTNAVKIEGQDEPAGLLVVRRVGYRDVGDWYAVQRMGDWWGLYRELLT